jgi:predicted dehydrogenase
MSEPIRLALIGAGTFARAAHLPALQSLGTDLFRIRAIYSRQLERAASLCARLPEPADAMDDLEAVLTRSDIEAVVIVLPIDAMPAVVARALHSGKHVLSEKPIAPDVATAQMLIRQQSPGQVWLVGENFRYNTAYQQVGDWLRAGEIGQPLLAHLDVHFPIMPDNKYFNSAWRQQPQFPGGWLLDIGVHHVATLRLMLGEVVEVSAHTAHLSQYLNVPDTLVANLRFASGLLGQYSVTYAPGLTRVTNLIVRGEGGVLQLSDQEIVIQQGDSTRRLPVERVLTIDAQYRDFAAAIRTGQAPRSTPQAALRDLAVMQAMLTAAETGQRVIVADLLA